MKQRRAQHNNHAGIIGMTTTRHFSIAKNIVSSSGAIAGHRGELDPDKNISTYVQHTFRSFFA
jgi:hypothetical protein